MRIPPSVPVQFSQACISHSGRALPRRARLGWHLILYYDYHDHEKPHCLSDNDDCKDNDNDNDNVSPNQVELYLGEHAWVGGRSCRMSGREANNVCAQFQVRRRVLGQNCLKIGSKLS